MPNKISRVLFCLLFVFLTLNFATAQSDKPADVLKKADNYFSLNLFDKAIPLYLNLQEQGDLKAQDLHNLGKAMLQANNTDYRVKAEKYLEMVLDGGKFKNDIYYDLGLAYHYSGSYQKASANYKRYVDLAGDNDFKGIDAKRKVKSAARAEDMIASPKNITVTNVGSSINSAGMEYNPVLTPDNEMMLFTARRAGVNGGLRVDGGGNNEDLGVYFEDVFLSKLSGVNQWSPSVAVNRLNGKGHDACLSMSSSGKKLYLYKSDDKGEGNLYTVNVNGENFGIPEKMDENFNSVYVESGISVAPKGNVIYFTSNRPGGYGGKDIYVIYKQKGDRWSEPKNMGPRINTQYNDVAPYITPDGKTLYFSSQGHINIGGYDIFETKLENNSWSKPENMGYPINTVYDDAHFYVNNDGKEAYISSNRPGGLGSYDIYQVDLFPAEDLITLAGNFDDGLATLQANANITVEQTDNNKVWFQQELSTADNFMVKLQTNNTYQVNIEVDGKEDKIFSFTLSESNQKSMEVFMDIDMDEVTVVSSEEAKDKKDTEVVEKEEEEIDVEEALKDLLTLDAQKTQDSIRLAKEKQEDEEFELEEELLDGESIVDAVKRKKREAKEKEKAEKDAIKLAKKQAKDAEKLSEEEVELAAKEAERKVKEAAEKAEQEAEELARLEKEKAKQQAEKLALAEKEKADKEKELAQAAKETADEKEKLAQAEKEAKEKAKELAQTEKEKLEQVEKETKENAERLALAEKEKTIKDSLNNIVEEGQEVAETKMTEAEKKAAEAKAFKEEAEKIAKQLEEEENLALAAEKLKAEAKAKANKLAEEKAQADKLAEEKRQQEAIRLAEEEAMKKVKPENYITINHIYYGFNGSKLTPESIKQLDELAIVLAVRKELTVILSGHTDNKGSDAYNMILSLNRARAIANYLIGTRGLNAKRFNITGFGENYPIAQNEYENGADNETGRTYNRRTEFKVNTNSLSEKYYMEYNRHPFPPTMRSSLIYAYYRDFEGVCFRVQLTQSSAPISNKTIAGLQHVMAEDVDGNTAYLAGLFKGYEEAEEYRRKLIKMKGLRNTKVVAYVDGFRTTISEAKAHQHTLVK